MKMKMSANREQEWPGCPPLVLANAFSSWPVSFVGKNLATLLGWIRSLFETTIYDGFRMILAWRSFNTMRLVFFYTRGPSDIRLKRF